jgi:hypothetical protein
MLLTLLEISWAGTEAGPGILQGVTVCLTLSQQLAGRVTVVRLVSLFAARAFHVDFERRFRLGREPPPADPCAASKEAATGRSAPNAPQSVHSIASSSHAADHAVCEPVAAAIQRLEIFFRMRVRPRF